MTLNPEFEQSVVYASDLELGETVALVMNAVREFAPQRVVFDSASKIRLIAQNSLRFRRQILAPKHFFAETGCTVLLLDDLTSQDEDGNLHSLAHGVLRLEQISIGYGADRRRVRVLKMRGRDFIGGFHDYVISRGGLDIFPRMVATTHMAADPPEDDTQTITTGIASLDDMVGGGLVRGTSTLVMGPSGVGKSTLTMQIALTALDRGERVLVVTFDETLRNVKRRMAGLGFDLGTYQAAGLLELRALDPAELTPGELTDYIREQVAADCRMVILDSLSGYYHAMPDERFLLLQIHELLSFLNAQNVITFITLAQLGMVGSLETPFDITYIADATVLLRFFEADGELGRAISMQKHRTGAHEMTVREMTIGTSGIEVGSVLRHFSGILTGVPTIRERHPKPRQ